MHDRKYKGYQLHAILRAWQDVLVCYLDTEDRGLVDAHPRGQQKGIEIGQVDTGDRV